MPRYFLNLRDGTEELLDPEGVEHDTVEALAMDLLQVARGLMSEDIRTGTINLRYRIDAEDGRGAIVYSLPFHRAVTIIS